MPDTSLNEKIQIMSDVSTAIVNYLIEQVSINNDALKAYEFNPMEDIKISSDVRQFREIQAFVLREKIHDLNRHIAVIKRMYPDA